ncbi:MAG TPA: hypothetical protein RMH99_13560 [Sandaracinaceae bacterium LLY-WYZ-13_1]|nr:hypothetical protein [Sandaracinaceae bacterium LLY-WYZ-13_1]
MRIEHHDERRLALRNPARGMVITGAIFALVSLAGLLLAADRLQLACDRADDRCVSEHVSILHGTIVRRVPLSRIERLAADGEHTRAPGRSTSRVLETERYAFVRDDGTRVPLEPRRGVLFDEDLPARFAGFRQGDAPTFEATELHVGPLGFGMSVLLAIGLVLLVVAEGRGLTLDREAGRFVAWGRGVRAGFYRIEGALDDVERVEVNADRFMGVFLALRDGRRIYAGLGQGEPEPTRALGRTIAEYLDRPLAEVRPEVVRAHLHAYRPSAIVGCLILALIPLTCGPLWCLVSAVARGLR